MKKKISGIKVEKLRLSKGLTQQQLADKIGIHRISIINIEKENVHHSLQPVITALANALEVKPEDILE